MNLTRCPDTTFVRRCRITTMTAAVCMSLVVAVTGCQSPAKDYPAPEPAAPSPQGPAYSTGQTQHDQQADRAVNEVLRTTPDRTTNRTTETTGIAVPDEKQPTNLDRETAAALVAYYSLDDVNVAVLSLEDINEHGLGDEVAQRLRETFSELGMRVQNTSGTWLPDDTKQSVRRIAADSDSDLVTVCLGTTQERSRFGSFLSYEADLRGTVYEGNGDILATKELSTVGDRSSDPDRAAESALLAAADNIGQYLVEQIVRKVGQNALTQRLTIEGLRYHASVMKVIAHLKAQSGINDVRLISWDEATQTARILVYLQPAARDNLGGYVSSTPGLDVRIESSDRRGLEGEERKPLR